jgi:hypothetical protein
VQGAWCRCHGATCLRTRCQGPCLTSLFPVTLNVRVALPLRRRRRSRCLAGLFLLVWLAPLVAPHAADDDVLCVPLAPSSDAASASWTTVAEADQQPHHCVICHSLRSYRTALSDCGPAAVNQAARYAVDAFPSTGHRSPALDSLPARAPPA